MPERDANQLAADVRAGLIDADADALVARVTDLEARLAVTLTDLQAAEAQVTALTRGYDSATLELEAERHARITDNEHLLARAEAAEAALATTRQALTQIADQKFGMATVQGDRLLARRALADTGGDTA